MYDNFIFIIFIIDIYTISHSISTIKIVSILIKDIYKMKDNDPSSVALICFSFDIFDTFYV